jgi:4-diphosphocytidyl-2-C-methyl-D-erythritol kinase
MPQIRVEAPAKLNLHLGVGPGRPDGYHDIDGIFLALAFGDTLEFETVPSPAKTSITMNWRFPAEKTAVLDLPVEKNIIFRAVSLFRARTGYDRGLKITVEKRIPAGGGLGGGSSDAAATLLALNRLISHGKAAGDAADSNAADGGCPVTAESLAETGAALGSDVPFFLNIAASATCAARVSGRGESVQPLAMPEECRNLSFLLVNPGFPSDTASAFRLVDSMGRGIRDQGSGIACGAIGRGSNSDNSIASELYPDTSNNNPRPLVPDPRSLFLNPRDWLFFNDFLPVFEASGGASGAVYREILTRLKETGAEFAGLSGSGSTCFGVFSSRDGAAEAKESLLKQWPLIIETFPLAF